MNELRLRKIQHFAGFRVALKKCVLRARVSGNNAISHIIHWRFWFSFRTMRIEKTLLKGSFCFSCLLLKTREGVHNMDDVHDVQAVEGTQTNMPPQMGDGHIVMDVRDITKSLPLGR